MPFDDRRKLITQIEQIRKGRRLVSLCNFDRESDPPIPGVSMNFYADLKESLFRVLKETPLRSGLDVLLYTRGGDTNAVWPIVSLLREFDEDFQVLVPFRAHSSGTMFALAAKTIWMTPIAELSPIDPSTGNQFNPVEESQPNRRLGISVEDVTAYSDFLRAAFRFPKLNDEESNTPANRSNERIALQPFVALLAQKIHPLALGNVHRVHEQIKLLAGMLLDCHRRNDRTNDAVIKRLTSEYNSHLHMINRREAQQILGEDHVKFAPTNLAKKLDELLRRYEDDFHLRRKFLLRRAMGDEPTKNLRFVGGVVESSDFGYVYETELIASQSSQLPQNVQVQVPPGQKMELLPGLPRNLTIELQSQGWVRNKQPKGITA